MMKKKQARDLDLLKRLWTLSCLEQKPTAAQKKEFAKLTGEYQQRLRKLLVLEDRTLRLARYLKAA